SRRMGGKPTASGPFLQNSARKQGTFSAPDVLCTIIHKKARPTYPQSCLIQDEPGGGAGFSYKMSLEERSRMLGFDHQRADIGTIEPGADSGVFGRQFRGRIQGPESRG